VSIEITEIIWICNVMGFFFKFGKQIEENIGFNIQPNLHIYQSQDAVNRNRKKNSTADIMSWLTAPR
jgi:hypothetical protein